MAKLMMLNTSTGHGLGTANRVPKAPAKTLADNDVPARNSGAKKVSGKAIVKSTPANATTQRARRHTPPNPDSSGSVESGIVRAMSDMADKMHPAVKRG
jgi:hypothetical protein